MVYQKATYITIATLIVWVGDSLHAPADPTIGFTIIDAWVCLSARHVNDTGIGPEGTWLLGVGIVWGVGWW